MQLLKTLFTKDKPLTSYAEFWQWFEANADKFYQVIKKEKNISTQFFSKLSVRLDELKDGYWFLSGMTDNGTAELILTADGILKNIVFVEELVAEAPPIKNWRITALKQPSENNRYALEMEGLKFTESTMHFYAIEHPSMPDEIDIVVTHSELSDKNRQAVTSGVYLALDNTLGELNSVTTIDNLSVIHPSQAQHELISIEKLRSYLSWREKEFVEKYEGTRHSTENDAYTNMEGTLENGLPLVAVINATLLDWEMKASHPWMAVIEIEFDGKQNKGMPDQPTYQLLNQIEDRITSLLKDIDGYLNIGRQTADGERLIYFACHEFRTPSKILYQIQKEYESKISFLYDIYKDKYWQSLNRFRNTGN